MQRVYVPMYKKDVNIGSIISSVLKEQKISISSFARQLGFGENRSRVYSILNSMSIDTNMLIDISNILNYPFLAEYSEEKPIERQILQIETIPAETDKIITALQKDKRLIITKLNVVD